MGIDAEMFVRTREPITAAQVRDLCYEMGAAFGPDRFWIFRDWDYYEDGVKRTRPAMEIVDKYEQDGPDIIPEEGETFLRVYPATRFYGKGYERGDIVFLLALARWLEAKIPGGSVFYGGDSSGVAAEPFGTAEREEMWQHFLAFEHAPYSGAFERLDDKKHTYICPDCAKPMGRSGWGASWGLYVCRGCNWTIEVRDGKETGSEYKDYERRSRSR